MNKRIPLLVTVVGLILLFPIQRWIDRNTIAPDTSDDALYLSSGEAVRRLSLGLQGLASDVYWIRTVQYFGRKVLESGRPVSAGTRDIEMPLLAPLLEIVTTLDPHHQPAYRFAAIFLPERDMPAAIAILEKGFRENPDEWRICQDLGYIYWQAGNAANPNQQPEYYAKAADWYEIGGQIPGALWWMKDLAGLMRIRGGARETAYTIYSDYLNSSDQNIRQQAVSRLKQLQSLDEIDIINSVLDQYRAEKGVCPSDLRVIGAKLRSLGLTVREDFWPLDPEGTGYDFDPATCKAKLLHGSSIAR